MSEGDITPAPRTAGGQAWSGAGIAARWIGVPLVAVVAGGMLASIAVGIWFNVTQKDRLLDDLTGVYPESAVVCRVADAACAKEAAERAHRPMAWIPDGRGFETTAVVVAVRPASSEGRPAQAFQDGRFRDALITIENDPLEADDSALREVEVGSIDMPGGVSGTRGRRSDNGSGSASARWNLDGRSYRLAITVPFGDGDDAMRLLNELADLVRYADPR